MKHDTVTPYNKDQQSKKEQVEEMFDNIAFRYDFLNHFLSAGIDKSWRKEAIRFLAPKNPKVIADIATGTGDFALEAIKLNPTKVIGIDISRKMLDVGEKKASAKNLQNTIFFEQGDSENLSYPDNTFDAITVGFGVRNFENLEKGLLEIKRVLNKNGSLVILEVSKPTNPFISFVYTFYFHFLLPTIGRIFSKDSRAYTYLPESVEAFPRGTQFTELLERLGYCKVSYKPLTFGICAMYTAEK